MTATVTPLKYKVNVNTLEQLAAERLELNDIGVCELELDRPIAFDPYAENRELGGFILIDRLTNNTVGAGTAAFRAAPVAERALAGARRRTSSSRARQKRQQPCVLWFTGLSGAGKSTIANLRREAAVRAEGRHTYLLDGDNVRHGLNKDLGFTDAGPGREHPPRRRSVASSWSMPASSCWCRSSRRSVPSGAWRAS